MPIERPNQNASKSIGSVNKFRSSNNEALTEKVQKANPKLKKNKVNKAEQAKRQEELLQMLHRANIDPKKELNWVKDENKQVPAADFSTYFQWSDFTQSY